MKKSVNIVNITKFVNSMLSVYKASAGSGKTHSLSREYLSMLLSSDFAYRHILAVTFTNKATEEMKRRIIEELDKLSDESKKSDFIPFLCEKFNFSDDPKENERRIREKARNVLVAILHDYSAFSVSTIDKFFQQTMRSFAREIGKNSAYSVEVDESFILEQAIDNLILELGNEENKDILNWLITFSLNTIENGNGWDIRSAIKGFASELFKEAYRLNRSGLAHTLNDKKALISYIDALNQVINDYESRGSDIGRRAIQLIQSAGLELSDFTGGSRTPINYFKKLAEKREFEKLPSKFESMAESADNFTTASTKKSNPSLASRICDIANNGLIELTKEAIKFYEERKTYFTAKAISEKIYILGILTDIDSFVQKYSRENNKLLLSETNELLNKIIDGSDTPFIYEKIGTRIDNYMLDEFQDTSILQWKNFYPLLLDSLSSGKENLIVGDVKQSIYRWRGSEWRLLNSGISESFDSSSVQENVLTENWRSSPEIVEFNNSFFRFASSFADNLMSLSGEISVSNIYSDAEQQVPDSRKDKRGHVLVNFVEKQESDQETNDSVLSQLPDILKRLQSNGYSLGDIVFLVRKNKEGQRLAEFLIEQGFGVISDDSLFVSNALIIKKIIAVLRHLNNPEDKICARSVEILGIDLSEKSLDITMSMYQMCEEIIQSLNSEHSQSDSVYIQAFKDIVLDFTSRNGSDIALFLEWWDEYGVRKCISSPQENDSVRVMTIHKSKGLGMKVVIIPFFSLELSQKGIQNTIWCSTENTPFSAIPSVPVTLSSKLKNSFFENDYILETTKNFVDSLNLAYVAFTRAKQELIIFCERAEDKAKESDSIKSISQILYKQLFDDSKDGVYELGEWTVVDRESSEKQDGLNIAFKQGRFPHDKLKLSFKADDFFDKDNRREYGLIMHDILSVVETKSDLEVAVEKEVLKGTIMSFEAESLIKRLSSMIDSVQERDWFTGAYEILTERDIILPGGEIYRPDRVMIDKDNSKAIVVDYKFGLKHEGRYNRQIENYISILSKCGYSEVEGYLWYLEENQIYHFIAPAK